MDPRAPIWDQELETEQVCAPVASQACGWGFWGTFQDTALTGKCLPFDTTVDAGASS